MSENYGKVLESRKKEGKFEGAERVTFDLFRGWCPVAYYDDLKLGDFQAKEVSAEEKEHLYDVSRGVVFVCPLKAFLGRYRSEVCDKEKIKRIEDKKEGLNDFVLARILEKRQPKMKQAKYHDCILTKDGTVIYKSEVRSVDNTTDAILRDFYRDFYECSGKDWKTTTEEHYENGTWYGVAGLRIFGAEERIDVIYSQIAKYVAEKSVEECGICKGELEFETAKLLPAQIFTANPEFVCEVLSGVEDILTDKLESVKDKNSAKVGKIVRFGEKVGRELKKIFSGKFEEAKAMSQEPLDTNQPFKKGTFDATGVQEIAKDYNK